MSRNFSSGGFVIDLPENLSGHDFEERFFTVSSRGVGGFELCDYVAARSHAIKKHRDWNSRRPRTKIALKLFQNVQVYLPGKLGAKLELFCSVGTALDQHHGVDGFFTIGTHDITFDLSTYKKKSYQYKADFLITPKDLEDDVRWKLGREIAYMFQEHEADRLEAEKRRAQSPAKRG
jgi:hypothetical protein